MLGREMHTMPSCELLSSTPLATSAGWELAGVLPESVSIWGIDRNGRWAQSVVTLRVSGTGAAILLGSQQACSSLSEQTLVQVVGGNRVEVGGLIDSGSVRHCWFEVADNDFSMNPGMPARGFWSALRAAAAFASESAMAFRIRSRKACGIGRCLGVRGEQFLILARSEVEASFAKGWAETVTSIVCGAFNLPDTETVELHRDWVHLLSWLSSARAAAGHGSTLAYDSIQHTVLIYSDPADLVPPSTQGASCSRGCLGHTRIELEWPDRSWSPVSGGFILQTKARF